MTARSLPIWIGKTPDEKIPRRVRLRVFEKYKGICHLSGRKIMPGDEWDCDHIIALINGGRHAEDNLAPALRSEHKKKTASDVKEKAKSARIRARHAGIKKPRTLRSWRRFNGTPVHAPRER